MTNELVDRLRDLNRNWELCLIAADEIERLQAQLSARQKDAERYRWLQSNSAFGLSGAPGWSGVIRFQLVEQDSRNMSEAIDAAIAAQDHPVTDTAPPAAP